MGFVGSPQLNQLTVNGSPPWPVSGKWPQLFQVPPAGTVCETPMPASRQTVASGKIFGVGEAQKGSAELVLACQVLRRGGGVLVEDAKGQTVPVDLHLGDREPPAAAFGEPVTHRVFAGPGRAVAVVPGCSVPENRRGARDDRRDDQGDDQPS
ncbi:hypothetical protein [Acrocarpospora sp. B8E8]|uniref:hypothetical protein n=1 Tax=Acrocarpospora sp. B8E8 TaxID=3153572 RepID=UPI00325DB27F